VLARSGRVRRRRSNAALPNEGGIPPSEAGFSLGKCCYANSLFLSFKDAQVAFSMGRRDTEGADNEASVWFSRFQVGKRKPAGRAGVHARRTEECRMCTGCAVTRLAFVFFHAPVGYRRDGPGPTFFCGVFELDSFCPPA
jgi:hypothetical protein